VYFSFVVSYPGLINVENQQAKTATRRSAGTIIKARVDGLIVADFRTGYSGIRASIPGR